MAIERTEKKLWLGGTSGIARTFMNAFGFDDWIVIGLESVPPPWMPSNTEYYSCDFSNEKPANIVQLEKFLCIKQIVISIRPPLVSSLSHDEMTAYCKELVNGMNIFLQVLLARNNKIQSILHISSVAAANHLVAQHNVGYDPSTSETASLQLIAPYDVFKRACEEVIADLDVPNIVHLRLSAIFSDDAGCIQCQALQIQSRVGSYLPQRIDCNSSRNVATAIHLLLSRQQQQSVMKLSKYYYYTRPARQYPNPVPYGEYLAQYRRAHDLRLYLWLPSWLVNCFVETVHWLAQTLAWRVPYLDSIDYLLQVSYRDHCFDNSDFLGDFPEIVDKEETIQDCFRRRQKFL